MQQAGAVAEKVLADARAKGNKLGAAQRSDARVRRQKNFLEAISQGNSIDQACDLVGITRHAYNRWRQRYPEFRGQMDGMRVDRLSDLDTPYSGDFIDFRYRYFGMETYWHQREIIHAIQTAKGGEVVLILVPPEHGKTTVLCDYVCYKLATDSDFRILYISEGSRFTQKFLGRVQRRMTDPHVGGDYMASFGPFHVQGQEKNGKPWTSSYMTVFKYQADEQDFSLEGRGWTGTIAGNRTNLMLVDDMQSRRSLSQTEKMIETFRQDFITRPGKDGVIVIVMTRVGQGDFPERLQDEGIVDKLVMLPALDENEKSLCPEMWPEEALKVKRQKVGETTWWRNYMQKPRASMDATFTEEMIDESINPGVKVGHPLYDSKVAGLDPAIAGGNALTVWSYDTDNLQLVDLSRKFNLSRLEAIINEIDLAAEQYHFHDFIIEVNSWQQSFIYDDRFNEVRQKHGFRVHTHITGKNKYDADLGVARMPSSFIKNEIIIPGEDPGGRLEPLLSELREWHPDIPTRLRRQDCVMSMWFVWMWWLNRRATMMSAGKGFTRAKLPWTPSQVTTGWRRGKGLTR